MKPASSYFKGLQTIARVLLLSVFLLGKAHAADYYWVGGTGNWSDYGNHWATTSGGNIFHTAIPSINDNVYFDANSFTSPGQSVTFDNTFIYCNNMDWTGVTNNPSVNGLVSKLNVQGSLTLVSGMTWSVKRIDFAGNGPAQQITTSGKSMDTLYFVGSGAYSLTDELNCISLFVQDGSFATSGNNLTANNIILGTTTSTVNVDFSTSLITCRSLFKAWDGIINLNSSSADLLLTNNSPPFGSTVYVWLMSKQFRNVEFQVRGEIIGGVTCQRLVAASTFYLNGASWISNIGTANYFGATTIRAVYNGDSVTVHSPGSSLKIREMSLSSYIKINGTCDLPTNFQPDDFYPAGTLTMPTGATVDINYAIITSINATGGAAFTAANSLDGGSNTGWNIVSPVARTLYWVGGNGFWNDQANWSLSSGGAGGNCIPSSIDDVVFDANSFTQPGDSLKLSGNAFCKNMDWSAVTNNPKLANTAQSNLYLSGSLVLSPAMSLAFANFEFVGANTGNTIFTAGQQINYLVINGTGDWTLADAVTGNALQIYKGTFNSANHDLNLDYFSANGMNNAIFVDLGSSDITISDSYVAFSPQLTISSANANLILAGSANPLYCQINDNAQFNKVTVSNYTYFYGSLTCNNFESTSGVRLNNLNAVVSRFHQSFTVVTLEADTIHLLQDVLEIGFDTLAIGEELFVSPDCFRPLTLKVYNPFASSALITKSSGTVNFEYTYLKNIIAQGGSVFNANNSWDLGGNTGWNFTTPPARDVYWVGGGGDWDDPAHWALSSNGAGGNCPPNLTDNIFFDSNSLLVGGQTINIDPSLAVYCNNLTFSGIPAGTILMSGTNSPLNINGSVSLVPELDPWSLNLAMTSATGVSTINTGNNNLAELTLSGNGTYELMAPLQAGNLYPKGGNFISNNHDMNLGGIGTGGSAFIDFGTSTVTALAIYSPSPTVTFDGDSADIIITSPFLSFQVANPFFNSVRFTGNANTQGNFSVNRLIAEGDFININSQINAGYAIFKNNVTLQFPFTSDTIVFDNPGDLVRINNVNVNDSLISNGTAGFPVQIEGYSGTGTLTKTGGVVCLEHVLLKDINATGGAQFFAGGSSVDLGGNSGWVFGPCAPLTHVWPGDANYDLIADNNDILNIGLAYGYTGPVRANASLAWVAQPANDWSFQFANTANLKHADTDGNGVVNDDDTLAVSINYGLTHPFRLMPELPASFPTPLLYVVANPDTASLSDTVYVDVFLGESSLPVDSIYGIAFTLNFDTAFVTDNFLSIDYSQCWMGTPQSDLITFDKNFLSTGAIDFAIVRNDQQNTTGFGKLAQIGVVVVDNVGAKVTMPVWVDQVYAITASEYQLTIATQPDSVVIDTTGSVGLNEINLGADIRLFPNPAKDQIKINFGEHIIDNIELFDASGRLLNYYSVNRSEFTVPVSNLQSGFYFLRINNEKGSVYRKFEVIKH
jgi:hypothetical protein